MAARVTQSGRVLEDAFFKKAKVRRAWAPSAQPVTRAQAGRATAPPIPRPCQPQAAGYVARSAYKLLEIQQKHKLIPRGGRVLDLGCHPGAWLQVACQALGPASAGGVVVGVDLKVRLVVRLGRRARFFGGGPASTTLPCGPGQAL